MRARAVKRCPDYTKLDYGNSAWKYTLLMEDMKMTLKNYIFKVLVWFCLDIG